MTAALTVVEGGREITQFKPEETREKLGRIEVLAGYGIKLRDDTILMEAANAKVWAICDIVEWLNYNVRGAGNPQFATAVANTSRERKKLREFGYEPAGTGFAPFRKGVAPVLISEAEALETLGYSAKSGAIIDRWRKIYAITIQWAHDGKTAGRHAALEHILQGWKQRAGMEAPKPTAAKVELDHDIAVEAIVRAFFKLGPDQQAEVLARIQPNA